MNGLPKYYSQIEAEPARSIHYKARKSRLKVNVICRLSLSNRLVESFPGVALSGTYRKDSQLSCTTALCSLGGDMRAIGERSDSAHAECLPPQFS